MNSLVQHDEIEICRAYFEYYPHIVKLFNYLNGKINKFNICTLNVAMFSKDNYAMFQYPNYVTIYAGSIIDHFHFDKNGGFDLAMSVLALCLTHELFHADQELNSARYTSDAEYATNAENAAEYNAEVFCYGHKHEFKKNLGFEYRLGISSNQGVYNRLNEGYISQMMLGVFRSKPLYDRIVAVMNENDTVVIRINNVVQCEPPLDIVVKYKGEITVDRECITDFANALQELRPRFALYNYTMMIGERDAILGRENDSKFSIPATMLQIDIEKYTFNPYYTN